MKTIKIKELNFASDGLLKFIKLHERLLTLYPRIATQLTDIIKEFDELAKEEEKRWKI